jgi:hypothetical protein
VVHFNATAHPTAEWTARQLIEAFPEEAAPRFLVRDRDGIYGERFRRAIDEKVTSVGVARGNSEGVAVKVARNGARPGVVGGDPVLLLIPPPHPIATTENAVTNAAAF